MDRMDTQIRHHADDGHGHYTLLADGVAVGELDHRDLGGIRSFTHTGVRPSHRHHGLAAVLVKRGLDDARREGLLVRPVCSYVARYLDDHPADADLVAVDR